MARLQRHEPNRAEFRPRAGSGVDIGSAATWSRQGDVIRLQNDIGNRIDVPAHVEEAFGVDRLFIPVAIHILGHSERDVGDIDDGYPLGDEDIPAPPEWSNEVREIHSPSEFGLKPKLCRHRGHILPSVEVSHFGWERWSHPSTQGWGCKQPLERLGRLAEFCWNEYLGDVRPPQGPATRQRAAVRPG